MKKNYTQLALGILIGLLIGIFISKQVFEKKKTQITPNPTTTQRIPATEKNTGTTESSGHINSNSGIPQQVYEILRYIRANNHAMPGYVGGRIFSNREKLLPMLDSDGNAIQYREWDVNPKMDGQNRGAERLVTGSDSRAWYTSDHYKSFKEIK